MKLNLDCIRDILLTVEEETDFSKLWSFGIHADPNDRLSAYSYDEIIYHVSQCNQSGLISGFKDYDGGEEFVVGDLTPKGHQFLSDIRSDTVWNDVKAVSSKVGSNSLHAVSQIASNVIAAIIQHQLGFN